MRLIDADELKSVFTEKSTEAVCGAELCKAIISRIDDALTIDAIPVSYIQQRIDRLRLLAEYEAEANGGYIGRSSMALFELEELIEYWKKEREQNV